MKHYPLANYLRHFKISVRHITCKKAVNILKTFFEYFFNKKTINSMPTYLRIEASRKCRVYCKYCDTKKEDKFFQKEIYYNILNKLAPWLIEVTLYDIGEPLWCDDLIDYIKYAKERNVGTLISSTLSVEKEESFWDDLVLSGLDYIIVAIDGITHKVYNEYRTNGNLSLVMRNLKSLVNAKRRNKSKIILEWQFIELGWNRHEMKKAKEMAKEYGMSFMVINETSRPREKAQKNIKYIRKRNCLLPYLTFNINAYGEVNPCYKYHNDYMKVGDIYNNSFEAIWNNSEIQKIRDKEQISEREICCKCNEKSIIDGKGEYAFAFLLRHLIKGDIIIKTLMKGCGNGNQIKR